VDFLAHRDAFENVLEPDLSRFLGEDRERVRIPLDEHLSLLDVLVLLHLQPRAVDDRLALAMAPFRVLDDERPAAAHDDLVAALAREVLDAVDLRLAGVAGPERRLVGAARGRAAEVERSHRRLPAGCADGLPRDAADRLAEFDRLAGREVAAVALRAHTAARR